MTNDLGVDPVGFCSAWCEVCGASRLEPGDIQNRDVVLGSDQTKQRRLGRLLVNNQDRFAERASVRERTLDLGPIAADLPASENPELRVRVVELVEGFFRRRRR